MRVTVALAALNVFIYAVMFATAPGDERFEFSVERILAYGGNHADLVRAGEFWRLATSMFVHVSPLHIASNMAALLFLGRRLENRYGAVRYALVYFIAGLCGSLASIAFFWNSPVASAGASGAIAGLLGAAIVTSYRSGLRGRRFGRSMLAWVAFLVVLGLVEPVDNAAHFGGLVVGALIARSFSRGIAAPLFRDEEERPLGEDIALPRRFCGDCGERISASARTCPACGRAQVVVCPTCRQDNSSGSRFCGRCGRPLPEAELERRLDPGAQPAGDGLGAAPPSGSV